MERTCFTFELIAGQEDEYERRHRAVWPELVDQLQANGVHNYTIFRRGRTVIAYAECEPDADIAFGKVGATDVNRRWSEWFGDVIVALNDEHGQPFRAREVWHLD